MTNKLKLSFHAACCLLALVWLLYGCATKPVATVPVRQFPERGPDWNGDTKVGVVTIEPL